MIAHHPDACTERPPRKDPTGRHFRVLKMLL
jgi:hypothetical protein